MKITFILTSLVFLFAISCTRKSSSNSVKNTDHSNLSPSANLSAATDLFELADDTLIVDDTIRTTSQPIYWRLDKISDIVIDKNLSHKKGFAYDSIIGIDYTGFNHEDFFYPVNEQGQYTSSIKNSKKLNAVQCTKLFVILSDESTYKNPRIVACYEPRLAFVYFKDNKIIAQTQVCLTCAQLRSTAKTISGEYGGLFNEKATSQLDSLRMELGFKNN